MSSNAPIAVLSLFALALCGWVHGQEPGDEVQQPRERHPLGPDHLTPVKRYEWREAYETKLKQVFGLEEFAFARVFSGGWAEIHMGEWAVSLHGTGDDRDQVKTEKFFLTCKIANQNVWYTMPGSRDPRLPQETLVSVTTVPIEKELALRLIKLWDRMLDRTAPRDEKKYPNTMLDGASYDFSTPHKKGEYQSMHNDRLSTGMFCDLCLKLQDYCEGNWIERRLTVMEEIKTQATKLEAYLDEHPVK